MSQDTFPVDFNNPVELNRYVYTANNPVNGVDPRGLDDFIEVGGITNGIEEDETPALKASGSLAEGEVVKAEVAQEIASSGKSMTLLNKYAELASKLACKASCIPVAIRTALELKDQLRAILEIRGPITHVVTAVLQDGEVYIVDNTVTSGGMYGNGIPIIQYLMNVYALEGQKLIIEVWPYTRLEQALKLYGIP